VLVYGGFGCVDTADEAMGGCTTLKALSDLWELSLPQALGGGAEFAALALDPVLGGLAGAAAMVLPGAEFRMLVFGGTNKPYPLLRIAGPRRALDRLHW
jgi:hypothetical protein